MCRGLTRVTAPNGYPSSKWPSTHRLVESVQSETYLFPTRSRPDCLTSKAATSTDFLPLYLQDEVGVANQEVNNTNGIKMESPNEQLQESPQTVGQIKNGDGRASATPDIEETEKPIPDDRKVRIGT